HVHGVEVARLDDAVGVDVDKVQAGRRSPVSEQPRLHVGQLQRLAEKGIVKQIDLADGEVVGRPPVGVDELQLGPGHRHHIRVGLAWWRLRTTRPGTSWSAGCSAWSCSMPTSTRTARAVAATPTSRLPTPGSIRSGASSRPPSATSSSAY